MRKEEISALSGPNEFAEFYSRLRVIKDYHRKYPNEVRRFLHKRDVAPIGLRWIVAQIYAFYRERPTNVDQHVVQTHESRSAEVSLQNAVFNIYIYNGQKRREGSLCEAFHPSCFKTTNFD